MRNIELLFSQDELHWNCAEENSIGSANKKLKKSGCSCDCDDVCTCDTDYCNPYTS